MGKYQEVEIAGTKRPVNFGMWALGEFERETGVKLAQLQTAGADLGILEMVNLLYYGLKHGARVAKKDFPYTPEDVADWLDQDPNATTRILEVFTATLPADEKAQSGQKKARTKAK